VGARLGAKFPGVPREVIGETVAAAWVLCAAFGFYRADVVERMSRAHLTGLGREAGIAAGDPLDAYLVLTPSLILARRVRRAATIARCAAELGTGPHPCGQGPTRRHLRLMRPP